MIARIAEMIWNPWLMGCFVMTGLCFSIRYGFFQVFGFKIWMKNTLGTLWRGEKSSAGKAGVSPLQVFATALGSTVGTGSIAGVATAIFFGGPGAVFWIWVSAILGTMIGFTEKTAAVLYRKKDRRGNWVGGPMYYISTGIGWEKAAYFFAAACAASALLGGNLVQANSIANAVQSELGWSPWLTGIAVMAITGAVMAGGLRSIAKVSELLVPVMAVLYICGGMAVVLCHLSALPEILSSIVKEAFRPAAAVGGCSSYGMMEAMRYGVARGVFTNEAGVGSSAIAHASSATNEPARQGMWGIFEVFAATIVICTVTALAILCSGVYVQAEALQSITAGDLSGKRLGAPLTMTAFGTVFGQWGNGLVAVCLILFAFTSILGWGYYGQCAMEYLTQDRAVLTAYRVLFLGCTLLGCRGGVETVWQIADICTALMAAPNLLALWKLLPEVATQLERWLKNSCLPGSSPEGS